MIHMAIVFIAVVVSTIAIAYVIDNIPFKMLVVPTIILLLVLSNLSMD